MTDYVTSCTKKIGHLIADVVCIFVYFLILMWATLCWSWWWLWEVKKTGYLTTLPPCPGQPQWPGSHHWTPSPQSFHLPMCVATGSPLSWSHHLSPHWGQGDIHELTFWSSLTQRRRSIIWTWSLWKVELMLLTRDFRPNRGIINYPNQTRLQFISSLMQFIWSNAVSYLLILSGLDSVATVYSFGNWLLNKQ